MITYSCVKERKKKKNQALTSAAASVALLKHVETKDFLYFSDRKRGSSETGGSCATFSPGSWTSPRADLPSSTFCTLQSERSRSNERLFVWGPFSLPMSLFRSILWGKCHGGVSSERRGDWQRGSRG